MTNEQPIIEIERINIVTAIQGREGSVMAERVMTFAGETRPIAPVNLYVGDFDVSQLPQTVQDALEAIDAQKQARIAELESQLSAMTAERDSLATEKAALTTERDSLQSQVAELTTSRDDLQTRLTEATTSLATATGQVEALTSERDLLQARVDELTAIAEQPICTNFQIRAWLITKFGLGIIDKVTAMIASIPDATQRLLANQQWEYANNVLRDNPFVEQIAAALGMKSDEMDAAYLEASKIV